jgi:hypothetical protein
MLAASIQKLLTDEFESFTVSFELSISIFTSNSSSKRNLSSVDGIVAAENVQRDHNFWRAEQRHGRECSETGRGDSEPECARARHLLGHAVHQPRQRRTRRRARQTRRRRFPDQSRHRLRFVQGRVVNLVSSAQDFTDQV